MHSFLTLFPNDQFLDCPILKESADNNFKFDEKEISSKG